MLGLYSHSNSQRLNYHISMPIRRAHAPQIVSPVFLAKAWLGVCDQNHRDFTIEDRLQKVNLLQYRTPGMRMLSR